MVSRGVLLLAIVLAIPGCVVPVRLAAGPSVDTLGRPAVEVRLSIGVGPGSSRQSVVHEVISVGAGASRGGLGSFYSLGAGLGAHTTLARRTLGLRGDLHYASRIAISDGERALHGPGLALGLQGVVQDHHRHLLLAGGEVHVDALLPFKGSGPAVGNFFFPLTLDLRLDVPGGGSSSETRVAPWFKVRSTRARKLIPHLLSSGPSGDDVFVRAGRRWVFVRSDAKGYLRAQAVGAAGRAVVLSEHQKTWESWLLRPGDREGQPLPDCGLPLVHPVRELFVCVRFAGRRVEATARDADGVLWIRHADVGDLGDAPEPHGFTREGEPVLREPRRRGPARYWVIGATGLQEVPQAAQE